MQVPRSLSRAVCLGARLSDRIPVLRSAANVLYGPYFNRATGNIRMFRGVYRSFSEASSAIPAGRLQGYDNQPSAVRLVHERLEIYPSDYPILFWLSRLLPECRLLFDWGGNVGTSYFGYRRYLSYPAGLTWLVAEVPAVVAQGQKIAAAESAPGLSFTTSLEELEHADLLLVAGVLQFIEDPLAILKGFRTLPPHILFNKVPVYGVHTAFTVHNFGSALCPYQLFNREDLLHCIQQLGYRLVDEWRTPFHGCRIPFFPEHSIAAYSGFYFRAIR